MKAPASSPRQRIDWEQVRTRLRLSETRLEQAFNPPPQRIEETYRTRAVRLAARPSKDATNSAVVQVMVLLVGQERFAIQIKDLAEIAPYTGCTPIPGAPLRFPGVFSLRGEIRTLVSLGSLLGIAADTPTESGFVLIPRAAGRQIGLKVDRVDQFLDIRADDLAPPGSASRFLRGVAPGPLGLLHMEAVLRDIYSGAGLSIEESNV